MPEILPPARGPRPAVLFDLDGTISDSFLGIRRSFLHALESVGAERPSSAFLETIAGPPLEDTLRSLGLDGDAADAAFTAYLRRYDTVGWIENELYDGMAALLRALADEGFVLATATSKGERFAMRILRHFGLEDLFAFVGAAEDPEPGRPPAPGARRKKVDVIGHALRGLGIEPVSADRGGTANVVMVGDRAHDVEGAAHYGIPTIAVTWGYGSPREWDTARWCVSTPAELRTTIDSL